MKLPVSPAGVAPLEIFNWAILIYESRYSQPCHIKSLSWCSPAVLSCGITSYCLSIYSTVNAKYSLWFPIDHFSRISLGFMPRDITLSPLSSDCCCFDSIQIWLVPHSKRRRHQKQQFCTGKYSPVTVRITRNTWTHCASKMLSFWTLKHVVHIVTICSSA